MPKVIPFPKDKPRMWSIKAKGEKEAEIWIYEDIGMNWFGDGLTSKQFAKDINALGTAVEKITVHIDSGGGNVFDGITIYNVLKQHKARVVIHIDGLAASIASVIAMAGDEINIAENAMMMIHEGQGIAMGPASELRAVADLLDKVNDSIIIAYMKHATVDEEKIIALMAAETWMSAEQAIEYGLADQLTESLEIAAHCDLARFKFKNAPKKFSNEPPPEPKLGEVEDPPDPKVESDPPPEPAPPIQDAPMHPKNYERQRRKRIHTTHGREE